LRLAEKRVCANLAWLSQWLTCLSKRSAELQLRYLRSVEDLDMTIQLDAVYQDGVLLPSQPIALPNGAAVRIVIETSNIPIDPLAGVIGIGDGPESGDAAERHDDYLYGKQ
jgi:predicted DNA-binding antitoxin AbrB/MazE fold protein